MEVEQPSSFQSIGTGKAADVFPKPTLFREEPGLKVPFETISGEGVQVLGRTVDGVLALSNFRFYAETTGNAYYNIPLGAIEYIECRDLVTLCVYCKDGRSLRCSFISNDRCQEWCKRLTAASTPPKQIDNIFAFPFFKWAQDEKNELLTRMSTKLKVHSFEDEIKRMKFDMDKSWRISNINENYEICQSYPPQFLVPQSVDDNALKAISGFRVAHRLPVVVWRHATNGAVIVRSSQPEVGILSWRSPDDEQFLSAVRAACAADMPPSYKNKLNDGTSPPKKALIMDARSFSTALVNRARGGGVECIEYYTECDIQFMNLPNIHTIRKSFQSLRFLCASPEIQNWWTLIDNTKWLHYIAGLLSAAVSAATAIDKHAKPVLVHCSDGWDRTPQIIGLAEILLDPFYRTIEGFQALVQREWLDFGHKFGDRCGNSVGNDDQNDRSPVFLQWLDCIHQLLRQFPCSFQYSEAFLERLVRHAYSNLFGTFLGNSSRERAALKIAENTFSVWPLLQESQYVNLLYIENTEVLWPSFDVKDMIVWRNIFEALPARSNHRTSELVVEPGPSAPPSAEKDQTLKKDSLPVLKLVAGKINGSPAIKEANGGEQEKQTVTETENVTRNGNGLNHDDNVSVNVSNGDKDHDNAGSQDIKDGPEASASDSTISRLHSPLELPRNRTVSEELYETYVGPLDHHIVSDEVENLNVLSVSQDSSISSGTIINLPDETDSLQFVIRQFDIDGLETPVDSVQSRLNQIVTEQRQRISHLEQELVSVRNVLMKKNTNSSNECSRSVSLCESEANSSSQPSVHSLPSDLSWEAVEERGARTTLWVPDHAVSACPGCHSPFWIGRRKHHCRKCGNIFCSDCSEHRAILPGEDLYYPVRVCNSCHSQVDACCCCSTSTSHSLTTDSVDLKEDKSQECSNALPEDPTAITNNYVHIESAIIKQEEINGHTKHDEICISNGVKKCDDLEEAEMTNQVECNENENVDKKPVINSFESKSQPNFNLGLNEGDIDSLSHSMPF